MWDAITEHISESIATPFRFSNAQPIGGGCINEAHKLNGDGISFFAKLNHANSLEMFETEAEALQEIAGTDTIRVPRPICHGIYGKKAYLVLEYLNLRNCGSMMELGRCLAKLHSIPQKNFGWERDNTIGSTLQPNPASDDWISFLRDHRLGFQCNLAKRNGLKLNGVAELLDRLDDYFINYNPKPSLLHGDLWSGNVAFGQGGEPVIYDPATYRGDREAEFGLAEMFGGFESDFWAAYESEHPLHPGYSVRKLIYRLYHTLNHFNLFRGSYGLSAEKLVDQLLSVRVKN